MLSKDFLVISPFTYRPFFLIWFTPQCLHNGFMIVSSDLCLCLGLTVIISHDFTSIFWVYNKRHWCLSKEKGWCSHSPCRLHHPPPISWLAKYTCRSEHGTRQSTWSLWVALATNKLSVQYEHPNTTSSVSKFFIMYVKKLLLISWNSLSPTFFCSMASLSS